MNDRIARRGRTPSALLALTLVAGACGAHSTSDSQSGTTAATIPDPVVSSDPAAQKLDAGLADAYRAMKAGNFAPARDMATAYTSSRGAAAHAGQAEFVVGMTYQKQQLYAAASEHFARALSLEPGFLETYYYSGFALFNLGRLADARAALAIYARHKPDDAMTLFAQGLVELEDDHVDEAERFIRHAIDIDEKKKAVATGAPGAPGTPGARDLDDDLGRYYARLGDIHVRRDDFERAKEAFTRATSLRADLPETWHKLETTCERLGDREGAQRARLEYLELDARRASKGR